MPDLSICGFSISRRGVRPTINFKSLYALTDLRPSTADLINLVNRVQGDLLALVMNATLIAGLIRWPNVFRDWLDLRWHPLAVPLRRCLCLPPYY